MMRYSSRRGHRFAAPVSWRRGDGRAVERSRKRGAVEEVEDKGCGFTGGDTIGKSKRFRAALI